jgi:transposase
VDATGLEARHVSTYFRWRRGSDGGRRPGQRQRAWPKLTCAWHVASHLILGAVTGTGPTQDSPDFAPALRQARRLLRLDTVLADAAYDAEHHHVLCRERLDVREVVIPLNRRNAGRRWPKTLYRRAARRRAFPHTLYAQRWHAESGFSRHKRRLGSALTTRRAASQSREAILRVLTHNLMLLARRAHNVSTEQGCFTTCGSS